MDHAIWPVANHVSHEPGIVLAIWLIQVIWKARKSPPPQAESYYCDSSSSFLKGFFLVNFQQRSQCVTIIVKRSKNSEIQWKFCSSFPVLKHSLTSDVQSDVTVHSWPTFNSSLYWKKEGEDGCYNPIETISCFMQREVAKCEVSGHTYREIVQRWNRSCLWLPFEKPL